MVLTMSASSFDYANKAEPIPPAFPEWKSFITSLNMQNCQLKVVPTEIFEMKNLVDLNLSHNKLTDFPAESLPSLERLNLSGNSLTVFSHNVSKVLTELYISKNQLNCFSIRNFKKLQILDLEENQLSNFTACVKMKNLVCLKLLGNPLAEFSVNCNLPELRHLSLPKEIYKKSAQEMHSLNKLPMVTLG